MEKLLETRRSEALPSGDHPALNAGQNDRTDSSTEPFAPPPELVRQVKEFDFATGKVRDLAMLDERIRLALEAAGVDTCCGGGHCFAALKLEFDEIRRLALRALDAPPPQRRKDWTKATNGALIDHIIKDYHAPLYEQLPQLALWMERAIEAHGAAHGRELGELRRIFTAFRTELIPHLHNEEKTLFPMLRDGRKHPDAAAEIDVLEKEHTAAGDRLREMEKLTDHYRVPGYACPTVRMLFEKLRQLDRHLHEHIYLENNILFPRA